MPENDLISRSAAKNEFWALMKELTKATVEPLPDNALGALAGYSIIENAPAVDAAPVVGGWISVKDKLPPSQKPVLLAVKSNYNGHYTITVGAHCNDHEITTDDYGWQDYEGDTEYDEEKDCYWVKGGWWETNYVEDNTNWEIDIADAIITHWMPLPEPPKEDDDAEQ